MNWRQTFNCPPYLQAHCQSPTSQRCAQSFVKELANPAQLAHRALGFPNALKNKINLRFVDRLLIFDTDNNKGQIIDIQTETTEHQHTTSATRQVRQQWFSVGIFPLGLSFGLTGNRP